MNRERNDDPDHLGETQSPLLLAALRAHTMYISEDTILIVQPDRSTETHSLAAVEPDPTRRKPLGEFIKIFGSDRKSHKYFANNYPEINSK